MTEALFLFAIFLLACFVSNKFLALPREAEKEPEIPAKPKAPRKAKTKKPAKVAGKKRVRKKKDDGAEGIS